MDGTDKTKPKNKKLNKMEGNHWEMFLKNLMALVREQSEVRWAWEGGYPYPRFYPQS